MTLSNDFIVQYAVLHRQHTNGANVWQLCEMSCEACKEGQGEVRRLAESCIPKIDPDTVYYRRDAWLGWQVFLKVPEDRLRDEHGDLAEGHMEVRELLTYSHFASVGAKFRQRRLRSRYDLAELLVTWARDRTSTRMASKELIELVGEDIDLGRDVRSIQNAALRILRHGEKVPLRLYRIARNIAATTWLEQSG